jgi:hypothetical protein
LDVGSVDDLKRRLREMGYSSGTVDEVLKWYKQGGSDKRV